VDQEDDEGRDYVVTYASRVLKGAETRYSTIERECLAIVFGVTHFRQYLYGAEIILKTDHKPLESLMKNKNASSRLIGWAIRLQDCDIKIKYRAGKANANADALSRIPVALIENEIIKHKDLSYLYVLLLHFLLEQLEF